MNMNKTTFLRRLNELLFNVVDKEREKVINYYDELIEDKKEDGLSEEEIVNSLGDPQIIAESILQDSPIKNKYDNNIRNLIFDEEIDNIDEIRIENVYFNIRIIRSLDYLVRVNYYESDAYHFKVKLSGRKLKVEYESKNIGSMFGSFIQKTPLELVIEIPEDKLEKLKIDNVSGKILLDGIAIEEKISINTISGEVALSDVSVSKIDIDSVTAGIYGVNVLADKTDIDVVSGRVELLMSGRACDYQLNTYSLFSDNRQNIGAERIVDIDSVVSKPIVKFTED